jgi:hypothetical protein
MSVDEQLCVCRRLRPLRALRSIGSSPHTRGTPWRLASTVLPAGFELETCVVRGRPGYHGVAVLDVGTNLPPDHLAYPVAILPDVDTGPNFKKPHCQATTQPRRSALKTTMTNIAQLSRLVECDRHCFRWCLRQLHSTGREHFLDQWNQSAKQRRFDGTRRGTAALPRQQARPPIVLLMPPCAAARYPERFWDHRLELQNISNVVDEALRLPDMQEPIAGA